MKIITVYINGLVNAVIKIRLSVLFGKRIIRKGGRLSATFMSDYCAESMD